MAISTTEAARIEYEKQIKRLNEKLNIKIGPANSFEYKKKGSRWFTGNIPFDILVNGGLKAGAFCEIYGNNDVGKSSLMLEIVQNQTEIYKKINPRILLIDGERNYTEEVMERYPINWSKVMLAEPDSIEEMFDIMLTLDFELGYIDSIPSLVSQLAKNKDMETAEMGVNARQGGRGWSQTYELRSKGKVIVAINQLSATMNQYAPTTTNGGNKLKYVKNYAVELTKSVSKANWIGKTKNAVGINYGGGGNSTETSETPFAVPVTIRNKKTKFGSIYDDERILYLRQRNDTTDEDWSMHNNKPGAFLDLVSILSLAQSTPGIIGRPNNSRYELYCPFTGNIIVEATGRRNFQEAILKSPENYYKLVCACYMRTLDEEIIFTNYRTILEVARYKTQFLVEHYRDVLGLTKEESEKLMKEFEEYPEKMMEEYSLKKMYSTCPEKYLELRKKHGVKSYIWDRNKTEQELETQEKELAKELKDIEKELNKKNKNENKVEAV